jgi:hypothetical protein
MAGVVGLFSIKFEQIKPIGVVGAATCTTGTFYKTEDFPALLVKSITIDPAAPTIFGNTNMTGTWYNWLMEILAYSMTRHLGYG